MNILEIKSKSLSNKTIPTEIVPVLEKIDLKIEKHKENAKPILSGQMTAFEAFQSGCEQAIASYIKMGNEGHITQKLVELPFKKSQETLDAEILIKGILQNFDAVTIVKNHGKYLVYFNGKKYDLQKIIQNVNFNQINLTSNDLKAYENLLSNKLSNTPFLNDSSHAPLYQSLTYGEKAAINVYTGSGYMNMNDLLRGDIQAVANNASAQPPLTQKAASSLALKETLLHVAVAVSGLNKLPDFVPNPGPDGQPRKYVYRGEYSVPSSVLEKRKKAVEEGGKTLWEMGFLSTAHTQPASGFFSSYSKVGIMIRDIKGKDVSGLSMFPYEREILFPPTQMQWLYHKEIVVDAVYHKTMDLFVVRAVGTTHTYTTIEDDLAKKAWAFKTQSVAQKHFASLNTPSVATDEMTKKLKAKLSQGFHFALDLV